MDLHNQVNELDRSIADVARVAVDVAVRADARSANTAVARVRSNVRTVCRFVFAFGVLVLGAIATVLVAPKLVRALGFLGLGVVKLVGPGVVKLVLALVLIVLAL